MATTTTSSCFRCQTWGHDNIACAAPPPNGNRLAEAVLLEFSEGFAELLGVSVRHDKLYALVNVVTQAAAPCSGCVATQTPSRPTPERAPPPPPAAVGESSPPSSSQTTQPNGEMPKNLDRAFLVQP
ncbi:hypothetical protein Pmani_003694 [Petrolisthes manimaculis]|uniref:Uncharacterized protein n=1 Tax=Petrolisthes manimaculis TaxID=1843537 RepID=A0AAE1QG27_9EUCA|nr:hypothetical protein Pmani_003694 [Petrolisthes manimaculis]